MITSSETTPPPYKLQMWPAHLLVATASGVIVLTMFDLSATRQYTWPWAPLLALAWLAPLIVIVGRLAFQNQWVWPNISLRIGLFLLSGITLLSAALSPFAQISLLRIWPTLSGVALFFWLHDWLAESPGLSQSRTRLITGILRCFGILLAVWSLCRWIWSNQGIVWQERNMFPFGHSLYTAGAMLLMLPWIIHASVNTGGLRRAGWTLATVIGLVALFSTSSRGGVLAASAVCAIAATFVIFRATWSRSVKTGIITATVIVLMIAVWTNPRLRELAQSQGWNAASQASNAQRNAMLEAGVKLGAERPLLGWGPGTIPITYLQIRHRLSGGGDSVLQLHNTPAQLWATLGIGGIAALLILLTAFTLRLRHIVSQSTPDPIALAAAASLIGYGLFALTDHELDVPALNALLVLNFALMFAKEPTRKAAFVSRRARWAFSLFAIILLARPLLLTGRDLLARFAYDQSLVLFDDGRPEEALEYLETAARRAPYDSYYRHQLANRLLEQRNHAKDQAEYSRLTAAARLQLEQSLDAESLREFAHFNLGWLTLEANEPARAIPHFLATVHDAPNQNGAYLGLGLALRAKGNETAAIRAFALEWINDPVTFALPLWELPDLAALRPRILHEADAILTELASNHRQARYVREWWSWWEHGTTPPANGFNQESDAFLQTLTALAKNQPVPPVATSFAWAELLAAWRELPSKNTFATLTNHDDPFAAALARRTVRHAPPNWREFLTAGLENEPFLLVSTKFSRNGLLALHPDGPPLGNLYVMQQNRLVATYLSRLFPPKGWLPAHELLSRLPAIPAQQP